MEKGALGSHCGPPPSRRTNPWRRSVFRGQQGAQPKIGGSRVSDFFSACRCEGVVLCSARASSAIDGNRKVLLPKIVERSRLAAECTESAYLGSAEALVQKATLLRGWLRLCAGKHAISRGDAPSRAPSCPPGRHLALREHPDVRTSCGVAPNAPQRPRGFGRGRNAIAMERGVIPWRGEFSPSLPCRCPALPLLHPAASRQWTHFSNSRERNHL